MKLRFLSLLLCIIALLNHFSIVSLYAQEAPAVVTPASSVAQPHNLFFDQFFMKPEDRIRYKVEDVQGFLFVESQDAIRRTKYALVKDFQGGVLKTQIVPGMEKIDQAKEFIQKSLATNDFEGVEIRRINAGMPIEKTPQVYFIGNKGYKTFEEAKAQIALIQSVSQAQGSDFKQMVAQAQTYIPPAEEEKPVEIKTPAQFQKEEEVMLRFLDQMDVGNELFGTFQGEPAGNRIVWQSFGETTWRKTNLDADDYQSQVGFFTNRVVFKGLRFPWSTLDPFVESTGALESNGTDGASHLDLSAGVEWRPLARNPWLENFRPIGIPLLIWVKNYRFYVQYFDRKNLKDEIRFARDYDLQWGVSVFYEFGIEPDPVSESGPENLGDYLRKYVWGEYFGNYYVSRTGFSSEKTYNAVILNSSIIMGIKLPGIPLPQNPINDELVLMPYFRFEHVDNDEFSFSFNNRYFVAAGIRMMPFRTAKFANSEWLAKTKIFGEFVGVGEAKYAKQDGKGPLEDAKRMDLRFGISISERRY